jgi:hypothetical protein
VYGYQFLRRRRTDRYRSPFLAVAGQYSQYKELSNFLSFPLAKNSNISPSGKAAVRSVGTGVAIAWFIFSSR